MELVTVVNRTNKPLEVLWDGKVRIIPVGKSLHTRVVAEKAKQQNPLMGSQDPRTGAITYLVGIEEMGEDCSPIEDTRPRSAYGEKWDRSKMPNTRIVEVIEKSGYGSHDPLPVEHAYTPNEASARIPEAGELGFTPLK